jgi:hypothetical protein
VEGAVVAHAWIRRAWLARATLGLGLCGCADVLGIPAEPRLAEDPAVAAPTERGLPSGARADGSEAAPAVPVRATGATTEVQQVAALSPGRSVSLPHNDVQAPGDAGVAAAGDADVPPGSSDCPPASTAGAAMDIVLILDNSGSMAAATAAVERGLTAWAALLDAGGLDYRLILLSRQRTLARSESSAASTSICVAPPLSGLAECPSPEPVLAERFFHYSIKIDATDSLLRVLESYATPDSFNLAPTGWSAWLRLGARKVFIEISDSDSELPASEFAARLSSLAPEQFGPDPAAPGYVFHSIVGLREKLSLDPQYTADEPIQTQRCRDRDGAPDSAGQTYQALSRATGGSRLALCPRDATDERLFRLATELLLPLPPACARAGSAN